MPDVRKKIDPKYLRKTLNIPIIQFVSEDLFRKAINDSLQSIVDFINQDKIILLGEIGWYIDNPENGTLVFASGWTDLASNNPDIKRNSGFNPKFKSDHTEVTGTPKDGRGLWFRLDDKWYSVTLGSTGYPQ
jgi:hypothetical protein